MKAIVQNDYGSPNVLKLQEVARPVVKENDVLVNVNAVSINAGDLFTLRGSPWLVRLTVGFPKPKDNILGWDIAGRVQEVGENVTQFQPGDEVTVKGVCFDSEGETKLVAAEVLMGDHVLALRDSQGRPLWEAWRKR